MRRFGPPPKVSVHDLIRLNELQELQDSFAEVANVGFKTVDSEGRPITNTSHAPSLCKESHQDSVLRDKVCSQCLPTFLGGSGIVDDDLSFECFPGLRNYLIPLKVSLSATRSLIVGYMVLGPLVFMRRKSREEFDAIARETGVDPYALWNFVLELRVFSYKGIRSLVDMIESVTGRLLDLSYGKMVMQKKVLMRLSSPSIVEEKGEGGRLDEFLELLLDLVMDITRGNSGSVMLLDRSHEKLTIRAAHGLPKEVMRKVSLKVGEGVAGLAAETKRSFLINPDSFDRILSGRLTKPDLFSSVVVPIRSRQEVFGVLNVSSDKTMPVRFDDATLAFLTKAAGLAGVALSRFPG